MIITLSQYAGFCDGVSRAFDIAAKTAQDKTFPKPIFMLGSLVHNEYVVKKIEKMGIKKIELKGRLKNIFENYKMGTLIITAHGMGPKIYDLARKYKVEIVDATCPKVIKVQRLAQLFSGRNYNIILIGDKNHKEVKGIQEWSGKQALICNNEKDLKKIKLDKKEKIVLLSQTTQNQDKVEKIAGVLKKNFPKIKIIDTLCLTTHNRQSEVKKLAQKNDAVIIIGSPESANSTHLFEIAKNINLRSYFIELSGQLKKEWFQNGQKIGITAGASTPDWIIKGVVRRLKQIA